MQARPKPTSILTRHDRVRIIGQGLTGTLLALHLKEMGIPFIVQDEELPGCATAVAPGIVNPLAGRNFRPPEYIHELLEQTRAAMELVRKLLGLEVWTACPILRMFADPSQHDRFLKSLADEGGSAFVDAQYPENSFPYLNDVYGSFLTLKGGWANLPLLMSAARDWLRKEGLIQEEKWIAPEQVPAKPDKHNELVVFCEGWHVANNPHWSFIRHNPAKGEMILVRFEEMLPRDRIYNQSCWVQPIEEDLWRVGATYSWSSFNSIASLEGATQLQENLHLLTTAHFHVEDQMAGVRPIVDDYQPVIGRHPVAPHWYILNAMGSKGVLQAPTAVRDLLDHLREGTRIPSAWSVDRFL
ncbi:MAG TPA: FAD-dependent oxidoreductase [Oceanipulchritudo sp.]|nr:FAD-dependent oxidoreductase [Oceanipulchritudo sp.]